MTADTTHSKLDLATLAVLELSQIPCGAAVWAPSEFKHAETKRWILWKNGRPVLTKLGRRELDLYLKDHS